MEKYHALHTYLPEISLDRDIEKKMSVELTYCLTKVSQPELLLAVWRVIKFWLNLFDCCRNLS